MDFTGYSIHVGPILDTTISSLKCTWTADREFSSKEISKHMYNVIIIIYN